MKKGELGLGERNHILYITQPLLAMGAVVGSGGGAVRKYRSQV